MEFNGMGFKGVEVNRRDLLKVSAVLATGSLVGLTGAQTAAAAAHPTLRSGSHGPLVLSLQQRLTSLGYWLGVADGQFGDLTRQSVMTVQKVAGLSRDGICGPATWSRIDAGTRPRARTTKGHVIEINKVTQTLIVVDAGVVKRTYNTSTGSNLLYVQGGKQYRAVTPSGSFKVFRRVNGWDSGPLGTLYRPQYFNQGIAVHGLSSVPATAASHGCARVSLPGMDSLWLAGGMQVGTTVLVY